VVFFDTSFGLGAGIDEGVLVSMLENFLVRLQPVNKRRKPHPFNSFSHVFFFFFPINCSPFCLCVCSSILRVFLKGSYAIVVTRCLKRIVDPENPQLLLVTTARRLLRPGEEVAAWLVKVTQPRRAPASATR
jgi:hypothetical protein